MPTPLSRSLLHSTNIWQSYGSDSVKVYIHKYAIFVDGAFSLCTLFYILLQDNNLYFQCSPSAHPVLRHVDNTYNESTTLGTHILSSLLQPVRQSSGKLSFYKELSNST